MTEQKLLLTVTPEQAGIPSSAVLRFIDRLEKKRLCMHSFILIRHGKIAAEGYWKPFCAERKHRMYSVTKSFTSLAIGLMIGEGRLSLQDRIVNFFPEKLPAEGVHLYIEKMTIRDLLMMASAHEKTTYKQVQDDDWVRTFFTVAPSHLPGQIFSYDTSASLVLAAIVEKLSGVSLLDYMRPRLLTPIGFSGEAYALKTPLGNTHAGSGLVCTSRDLAKVALVCLNNGRFEDLQLIPETYLKEAVSRQIDTSTAAALADSQQGYGYQFWRCQHNGYAMFGMGGQLAICLPDQDLVIVTTADVQPNPDGQQAIFDAIWEELYPALADGPLQEDSEAYGALVDKISQLSILLPEGGLTSEISGTVNGRTYRLAENKMKLTAVRFHFEGNQGVFAFEKNGSWHQVKFGVGAAGAPQLFPETHYESISAAAWTAEKTLLLHSYIIDEDMATLKMSVRFDGDTVTIAMRKFAELLLKEYSGFASGELE